MIKAGVSNQIRMDAFVLFVFIITFRLPQLLNPSLSFMMMASIVFFLGIYTLFIAIRSRFVIKTISKPKFFLVLLYLSIEFLAFLRAWISGVLDTNVVIRAGAPALVVIIFMFFSVSSFKSKQDLHFFMRMIIYGLVCLVLENLLFYLMGFESSSEYSYYVPGVLVSAIGLEIEAAVFSLEAAPKSLGNIMVFLAAISFIFFKEMKNIWLYFPMALICIGMIIVADARMYLAIILLLIVALPFHEKLISKSYLKIYLVLFPIIPLLLIIVASYIAEIPGFDIVARSASDNISTLSGRTDIWSSIGGEIQDANSEILYGYGAAGMVNSGINEQVSYMFSGGWADTGIKTAHNSILQQLLDKGLIGVIVFITLVCSLVMTFHSDKQTESRAFLYGFLALMLASALNTLFYYASIESYLLFIIMMGLHISAYFNPRYLHKNFRSNE